MPKFGEWEAIETAPKDGTRFLVFCPEDDEFKAGITTGYWVTGSPSVKFIPTEDPDLWRRKVTENPRLELEGNWNAFDATHWMPLPDPPSPAQEGSRER